MTKRCMDVPSTLETRGNHTVGDGAAALTS
jgi:hypothetical protein